MAESRPNPAEKPEKPERKEIADFRREYLDALERAKIQAEYTATEGWQELYRDQVKKIDTTRKELAASFKALAESAGARLLTEDEEKELGDLKKQSQELRLFHKYFENQILDPVKAPMRELEKVIEKARTTARNDSRQVPLLTGGRSLIDEMEDAINTMPGVRFLISSGRLEITPV